MVVVKRVDCNMTSLSKSFRDECFGKNCSSFLDFTRNYESTSGIFALDRPIFFTSELWVKNNVPSFTSFRFLLIHPDLIDLYWISVDLEMFVPYHL